MNLRLQQGFLALVLTAQVNLALADSGFTVREYQISGAQVEPEVVRPFTGENRSLDDIQQAARAVEQRLGSGWKVVIVPDQDVANGTVRLEAIRAELPRIVSVQDAVGIADYFTALRIGAPFEPTRARAQASLFRDLTGEFAQVDVQTEGNGIAVTLLTDPSLRKDPLRFSAGIDNTGTRETGLNRLTLTASHTNLWDRHHVASVSTVLSTVKPSDVRALVASYRFPLLDLDSVLDFYAADSKAASTAADVLSIRGTGTVLGVRITRHLAFDGIAGVHQFSAGIERRILKSEISLDGTPVTLTPDYAVRPLTLAYSYTQAGHFTTAVALSKGLGGGMATNEIYNQVRVDSKTNYTILRANGEVSLPITKTITGRLAANGQYTTDALVPAEQFGLGGASTIRGLQEREISNDKGYRISAEVSQPFYADSRVLAFVDHGRISRNSALASDPVTENVASTGVGVRFGTRHQWAGSVDFAHVLRGTQLSPGGDNRVHFQLTVFY